MPQIRTILDEHPEIWRHVGDLSALAESAWITVLASDNPLAVEAMKRTIAEMKADLAGEQPTRIGQMLTDQVVACWLETKFLETTAADPGKGSLEQAAFRLKRLESAQRRYLHAVTALSNVRRLVPAGTAPRPPIRLYEPNEQAV